MDIATGWNAADLRGDWSIASADLASDAGLQTAIAISLFTDRRAAPDDVLPDPRETDPRGWWGDLVLEGDAPDPIGSRLWLLAREKATEATRQRAERYIREALAWLTRDGIAQAVDIVTEWQGDIRDRLAIAITVRRGNASTRFDAAWSATLAA